MLVCVLCLPRSIDGEARAALASSKESTIEIDLPQAELETSILLLAQRFGVAVAWNIPLPRTNAVRLRGKLSPLAAFRRLLAGTTLSVVRVGPRTYRIETRLAQVQKSQPTFLAKAKLLRTTVLTDAPDQDIVVTARKVSEAVADIPGGISVVQGRQLPSGRVSVGASDVALSLEGLALTNLGPGRNRQFIRGVADSPFNGPSQSTVAVVLDEARITFDAPDPDLRLVDMDRIELLKGPQGPLYGSGALGGVYRMVPTKPVLREIEARVSGSTEVVQSGGFGGGFDGILNLPIIYDSLAVRGVGYISREAGWIDRVGQRKNANGTETRGGRLALRWKPDTAWSLDVAGVFQNVNTPDSRYVVQDDVVRRPAGIAEPSDNDFSAVSATLDGRLADLRLSITSSYVGHSVDFTQDASGAADRFGLVGRLRFVDTRRYSVRNHEARLSSAVQGNWLVGLSYMRATSDATETLFPTNMPSTSYLLEQRIRQVTEIAGFGDATVTLARHVRATIGARLSHTTDQDDAAEEAGATVSRVGKVTLSPSFSLSWRPAGKDIVYFRYARAVRPGGLARNATMQSSRFDADELGTAEIGYRASLLKDTLRFDLGGFYTTWYAIQSDFLLPNGLVSTLNAGNATVLGSDVSMDWDASTRLRLSAGASFVNSRLTRTGNGLEVEDRRLPITPDLSGRITAQWRFDAGRWSGFVGAQANYVGHSHLTFDPVTDRTMGNYAVASTNAQLSRSGWTVSGRLDNLFNIAADTFAFGNPFLNDRQFTPLRPRTFTLSVARGW